MDCTGELKADGLQFYHELISSLRWDLEISRVDFLLETAILSKHLAISLEGHLEQIFRIVVYLKRRKKLLFLFDSGYPTTNENLFMKYYWFKFYRDEEDAITPNMPEARGHGFVVSYFVDANHGRNLKDWKSQKGVLIFINKAPIYWYSKSQTTVETSTFGTEFCSTKTTVEMIEALRYMLRTFGITVEVPTNVYCEN